MTASNSPRPVSVRRRSALVAVLADGLGCGLGAAAGCTVILMPNDDVERCGNSDDCSPTGDERYVPICTFGEKNTDLDTKAFSAICVADFDRSRNCDPMQAGTMNGLREKSEETACAALACSDENRGKPGCRPPDGTSDCQFGEPDDDGFCGDPDADQPIIPAIFLSDNDLEPDQHIRDQFCKSFFCDDTFVCGAQGKCQPCDPDRDYGAGGCGIVYSEGAPAKIYVLGSDLEEQCAGGDVEYDDPAVFGECS
jgi:hypothetical protein